MKIGLVCPYNMFIGGGVQEVVSALQEGINARGHEAHVITPQPRNFKGAVDDGIIFVGGGNPVKIFSTASQVSASVDTDRLEEMLEEYNFDILHFHEPWVPVLSRQILNRSNSINIATFHAALPDRRMTRTIEKVITPYTKSILNDLDVLTAVSPAAISYVTSLTDRKINIIPNGIDLNKYTSLPAKSNRKTKKILYLGRLEKRKGVKYLIHAFSLLREKHPEFTLTIAGDGPDRSKLEYIVADNEMTGINFLGYVDEKTKLKLLQEADIFCSPALYGESFGIVLLEAMASGCVAVAGNNKGYEAVLDGRGQLSIVNPTDISEFARKLALLGTDKELRGLWQSWAEEEVEKYSYDKVVDQYMTVYENAYKKQTTRV
jgi:phosphatidyl-myo-inositol alpha-mannosyltransferase